MGNLTNLQKRQLCIKFSQVKMTQQELCQWAKREFQLAHLPHQSTISKILARSEELTQMAPRDLSARRKGLVTHPELDTALCNWVLCARHNGLKISGDIIKSQARALAAQLGIASTMSFSNGWLGGFKKRYNIRLGSAAAAVDGVGAMPSSIGSLEQLQETARLYDPRDVYCMQETGLYYQLSPEKPAGRGRAARKESCGERLTVVFAVNADASDKTEPMFIGPGRLPQPTEELDADSRHFYYQNNKRAWMTPVMFQDYVSALDTRMRDEGRIVLLLVSPAPSHVTLGLELTNVRLEVLPPTLDPLPMAMPVPVAVSAEESANLAAASESIAAAGVSDTPMADADQSLADSVGSQQETTTKMQPGPEVQPPSVADISSSAAMANMAATMAAATMLQPLDAGLITAFKRRYRRYHMLYALDRYEAGRQDVFHVDQLQAMRWTRHCWKQELPEEIVRKCWSGLEIFSPKLSPETLAAFDSIEEEIDKEICDTVSALDILRPLPIDEFVSPRDENTGIHCAGLEETDFMFTVPDNSGAEVKHSAKKASPSNADVAKQQAFVPNELTPRLQELHARIEASASSAAAVAAASALSLTTSMNGVSGDGAVALPSSVGSAEEALGLSTSNAAKLSDSPATNEQLIECFKMLLPELDRLRFDDHTKKSIRTTFRKLKETVEQQALDRKRGALKKPLPSPQSQQQFQQAMAQQQHSLQELQQLQQQQIQQMQQQLMMQSDQQAMAMAQASQIGENTVL
ncbi:unnamed protein product [Phytophthora fragariaefolia]|uniref:Unnamed protein product n=1 Tax=Phytophthora fragariaefolia TaxID=1490495 RepID=A0A9W6X723_9STRA|nr:unnamed protein product [Phytophthora fragariaefolia]